MKSEWTDKDKRQFDEVEKSSLEAGKSRDVAAEIAGRVVNKQRRKESRTPNKTTMGTGNPNLPYEERSYDELYNVARKYEITGRSRLGKKDLIDAIRANR